MKLAKNEKVKKVLVKLMATTLTLTIIVASGGMTAFAASSASSNIGGVTVSGEITTDATSATAKTSCPRAAFITAEARVDYHFNLTHYFTKAYKNAQGGTVVVTATRGRGGADVTGGRGTHHVDFDGNSWDKITETGTIYSNAIRE